MFLSFLAASPIQTIKSWVQKARQFYREVLIELQRVTWPDRREVIGTTIIVIIVVIVSGAYLAIMDEISFRTIGWIVTHFGGTPPVR